jgi:hypothetical protein
MTTKAQHALSQALKLLINEGKGLLNDMWNKQPGVVNGWAAAATGKILADEGLKLASYLCPQQGRPLTDIMGEFSLERILTDAEMLTPTLCGLLRDFATNGAVSPAAECRDNDHRNDSEQVCFHKQHIAFNYGWINVQYLQGHATRYKYVSTPSKD